MLAPLELPIRDPSQVGDARRRALALARRAGLSETEAGRIGIVVNELGNNLLQHAGGGSLLVQWRTSGSRGCVFEVVSIDSGPGVADIDECLADGHSTAGTPGNGLGAVRRLSTEFDAYSQPGRGTIVVSRTVPSSGVAGAGGAPSADHTRNAPHWAAVSLPAPLETECGDAWAVSSDATTIRFMLADGLGHGPHAATAARAVSDAFHADPGASPERFLAAAGRGAAGTRGAAVAAAQLTIASDRVMFAGIGNISAAIVAPGSSRGMMSHSGIVGVQVRTIRQFEHSWPDDALLVMHSDGLQTRWNLDDHPSLRRHDPMVVVAALLRDYRRGRDDVTVLVASRRRAGR
ncbi:MAG: ATP-binding protein [Lautropia sp.]